MTPSELIAGLGWGFDTFKLFPAQQAGGVNMLKAFSGPFPDVVFCPTGGITRATAPEFLALRTSFASAVRGSRRQMQSAPATGRRSKNSLATRRR